MEGESIQRSSSSTGAPVVAALSTIGVSSLLGCTFANLYMDHYFGEVVDAPALIPWRWIEWGLSNTQDSHRLIALSLFLVSLVLGCLLARFLMLSKRREHEVSWLHGTARFATSHEIEKAGLFPPASAPAIFLGQTETKKGPRFVRHAGPEHAIVFAPTRSGKGISIVVPTALSWQESMVCLDIKGELHEITSNWRRTCAGNIVHKIDLTDPSGTSARYNPLAEVRIGEVHEAADIANLVQMLIDPHGRGLEDHWSRAALSWLQGVVTFAIYEAASQQRTATLKDVAATLSSNERPLEDLLNQMLKNTLLTHRKPHQRIALAAQDMLNRAPEERSGVHSTAVAHMSHYLEDMLAKSLSGSDFRVRDLMQGDKPMTVYIVVRPSDIERLIPVARILINQIVRLNSERLSTTEKHYKHKLLLLLDEFPALGRMSIFEKALGYIAGYGMRALIITQDRSQLLAHYGKDESITANCHIRVAFAPNEPSTARWISDILGRQTVVKESFQTSGKRSSLSLSSVSSSITEVARPLMTPDEVMRLRGPEKDIDGKVVKGGELLIMPSGVPPIRANQVPYFFEREFLARVRAGRK